MDEESDLNLWMGALEKESEELSQLTSTPSEQTEGGSEVSDDELDAIVKKYLEGNASEEDLSIIKKRIGFVEKKTKPVEAPKPELKPSPKPEVEAPKSEPKPQAPKYVDLFSEGSEVMVAEFPADISAKLPACVAIRKQEGKRFRIRDVIYDSNLTAAAGIQLGRSNYVLEESLADKIRTGNDKSNTQLLALNTETGEPALIKMYVPVGKDSAAKDLLKIRDRFEQECYLTAMLDTPYIVKVKGIVLKKTPQGIIPFVGIATENLGAMEGSSFTLEQLMAGTDEFDPAQVVAITQPIASALRNMHNDMKDKENYAPGRTALVNRNINPSIITLLNDGREVITDFGLAKLTAVESDVDTGNVQTAIGTVVGDIEYISYEQARGIDSRSLTPATDVYSLCVIAYKMITGRRPYEGDHVDQIFSSVTGNKILPIQDFADQKKWGSRVLDMIIDGLGMSPKKRMPATEDCPYRWAARFEETIKDYAERKPLPELLDESGKYSEQKAQEVRKTML